MVARKCNFCGSEIEPGSGSVFVRKDGNLLNFCSRKCRVNALTLRRVSRRSRWTAEYHNIKNAKKKPNKQ
ncbi:MAG: 50S ribosomal protein L24e [Candidatus Thermoplasmatota archaeon]|nr:50S ribosomal protein L24e [Candidatus Thermoplasmatota archaeon]